MSRGWVGGVIRGFRWDDYEDVKGTIVQVLFRENKAQDMLYVVVVVEERRRKLSRSVRSNRTNAEESLELLGSRFSFDFLVYLS